MNSKDWLEKKLFDYSENPRDTLGEILLNTNNLITQYMNSPSQATKEVLDGCAKHNNIFFEAVGLLESDGLRQDMIIAGDKYWVSSMLSMPIEVRVDEVDNINRRARIEQGWIDFDRLYQTEDECPQR